MVCSTCGASIPSGREACTTCGAMVPSLPARRNGGVSAAFATEKSAARAIGCPRCGFQGPGVGYFTKGSHLAILLFLGVAALPFALLYFGLRFGHQICPRCGENWGRDAGRLRDGSRSDAHLADKTPISQAGAVLLALLAVILLAGGISGWDPAPLVLALGAGTGSALLFRRAAREREERRAALLAALTQPVLRLAAARQGRLTVTEVASELGWTLKRAEKVLNSMEDGLRVRSDVTDEGVIVYEFPELLHARAQLRQGATQQSSLPYPGISES